MSVDVPRPPARTSSPADLIRAIPGAPAAWLADALSNPGVEEEHVVLIARQRAAGPDVLGRIAADPRWARSYDIKLALAHNRHTPPHLSMNLVKFLQWRDLASVCDDPFLFPPLRRLAEKILSERVAEMPIGERIALARIAGRGLIPRLLADREPAVCEALLWNGRLVEEDLARLLAAESPPPAILESIAAHARWQGRHGVRLALARCPRAPLAIRLGTLPSLRPADLRAIADDADIPPAVRHGAERILSDPEWRRKRASEEEKGAP